MGLLAWSVFVWAVAPFAGARIEMICISSIKNMTPVAPFAGARIEMAICQFCFARCSVAPFAGARIEICSNGITYPVNGRRSLRGSED